MKKIKGVSLFSSAGIAEMYLKDIGIDIKVANELLEKRAKLYSFLHPKSKMIQGDITDKEIFNSISEEVKKNNCKFLIATPPCQGFSSLGKKDYINDERNFLIFNIIDLIDDNDFDIIFIENVPKYLKMLFPYKGDLRTIYQILNEKYSNKYHIYTDVLNAKDYGVAQSRPRGFILLLKQEYSWIKPHKMAEINLRECIGDLPSLESGEKSGIKWHNAKVHNDREIEAMSHTPEGTSAMNNTIYYPKKKDGSKIKGFHNTYKRMRWDKPAPARTIGSGSIGGHNNVHPGLRKADGTYTDARVLTIRELLIVSSLDPDMDFPDWCSDNFIREVIGEAIPPMFCKNILKGIKG